MKTFIAALLASFAFASSAWASEGPNPPPFQPSPPQEQNQGQAQGQLQGQLQGQAQGQVSVNENDNYNRNSSSSRSSSSSKSASMSGAVAVTGDSTSSAYGGDSSSYAKGGSSYSKGGEGGDSYSKGGKGGDSGGNNISTSTVVEGDEADNYPAASAIAGMASECVNVMAAQGMSGGFSLGGASAECQATLAAKMYFDLAISFQDSDPEKAAAYLAEGHKYAAKAAPGSFQLVVKDGAEIATDVLIFAAVGWVLGIPTW